MGHALVQFQSYDRANLALYLLNDTNVVGTNTPLNLKWYLEPKVKPTMNQKLDVLLDLKPKRNKKKGQLQ